MINKEYQIPNNWNIILAFETQKQNYKKFVKNQHNKKKKMFVVTFGKDDNYLNNKNTCHNIFKSSFLHLLHP